MIQSSHIRVLQNISFNPFFLSAVLQHFLSGYAKKDADLYLFYLVFPIIFYKPSRNFLLHANKKSSIYSMFLDDWDSRISLGGIQERYQYFRDLTGKALIVAANEEKISIGKVVNLLQAADYKKVKEAEVKAFFRAAHYLGVLFKKTNTQDIFRKLGVRSI